MNADVSIQKARCVQALYPSPITHHPSPLLLPQMNADKRRSNGVYF